MTASNMPSTPILGLFFIATFPCSHGTSSSSTFP
jgi:hypothetical protein